jgi:multiple sugar transport system permease protein/putative aldouronate transport system permease protein
VAAWNVIITRTYFQVSIPDELLEAAHIDGCGDFRFFREVVLPLSGAIIAVNGLFYAVGKWNAFFEAYIYLNKQRLFPLQLILREILIANSMTSSLFAVSASSEAARQAMRELLKFALIVVASAPVLAIYPFVQKYFVRGMLIGSIKG